MDQQTPKGGIRGSAAALSSLLGSVAAGECYVFSSKGENRALKQPLSGYDDQKQSIAVVSSNHFIFCFSPWQLCEQLFALFPGVNQEQLQSTQCYFSVHHVVKI